MNSGSLRWWVTVGVLLGGLAGAAEVRAELAPPVRVFDDDLAHPAPFLADLDGDGRRELLVGVYRDSPYLDARVQWFRDSGGEGRPSFASGGWLQAGGRDARADEFCYTGFAPQLADLDGDGVPDLVSTERGCGLAVFPGGGGGEFGAAERVSYASDGKAFSRFQYNARVFLHDWDRDGDLDVLAAKHPAVWFFENTSQPGTPLAALEFAEPVELVTSAEGQPGLRVPVAADWDGDGDDDLVVARHDGSVVWFRNSGGGESGAPELEAGPAEVLVPPAGYRSVAARPDGGFDRPERPAEHLRLCVNDLNGDGRLDLIVGDAYRLTFPRDPGYAQSEASKAAHQREAELRREWNALLAEPDGETDDARDARLAAAEAKARECDEAWRAARAESPHASQWRGSVWWFERLPD